MVFGINTREKLHNGDSGERREITGSEQCKKWRRKNSQPSHVILGELSKGLVRLRNELPHLSVPLQTDTPGVQRLIWQNQFFLLRLGQPILHQR